MKALKEKLGIQKSTQMLTARVEKPTEFTQFQDNLPTARGWNYCGDTLFLPETKQGFKYLLVVCDLAERTFDMEPTKEVKDDAMLQAYQKMLKRRFIKLPAYTFCTDAGNEFKGAFDKFLYNHNIYHKISLGGRHNQTSPVERLNGILADLFMNYLNEMEKKTHATYREWTDKIDTIRKDLNNIRRVDLDNPFTHIYKQFLPFDKKTNKFIEPKFKVGDSVYVLNQKAKDSFGRNQSSPNFRAGDYRFSPKEYTISQVLCFAGDIPYRYMVNGIKRASFAQNELRKAE